MLALKLEKHIPSESEYGTSRFSWVSFSSGEQKDSGVIDIEEGASGSSLIRADGFEVEWSAGDWIYLDQESEIATTEATEPAEIFSNGIVSPANSKGQRGKIAWYSIDELKRWHEKARSDAGEKLRIEQLAAKRPATAGDSK